LDAWFKKGNTPFPVGMIEGDEEQIRFRWGVKSLPWLILTDRKHVVTSEGFGLEDLDEKTKAKREKASGQRPAEKDSAAIQQALASRLGRLDNLLVEYKEFTEYTPRVGKAVIERADSLIITDSGTKEAACVYSCLEGMLRYDRHIIKRDRRLGPHISIPEYDSKIEVFSKEIEDAQGRRRVGQELRRRKGRNRYEGPIGVGGPRGALPECLLEIGLGKRIFGSSKMINCAREDIEIRSADKETAVLRVVDPPAVAHEFVLSKELGCAPVLYRMISYHHGNHDGKVVVEMSMEDLRDVRGISLPHRMAMTRYTYKNEEKVVIRRSKIDVQAYRLNDPKNRPERYSLKQLGDLALGYDSLVGKALPKLNGIDIEFSSEQAKDKRVLLCFFDMSQRPSRRMVRELGKRAHELKGKGVAVVCVQASKVDKNALDEWVKKCEISFPVGMVEGDEEKIRFRWGAKALPWLILTDREHIVRQEGVNIDELDEKIKAVEQSSAPLAPIAPGGEEVLRRLREFDVMYESGLTAAASDPGEEKDHRPWGTMGAGLPSRILPPIPRNWKLVMDGTRRVLVIKRVEVPLSTFRPVAMTDEEARAESGRPGVKMEHRTFWGPDYMARFEAHRCYSRDNDEVKVIVKGAGIVNFFPPDDTSHNRPLKQFLWSMGRGYSKHIFELTSVVELEDGTIKCSGPGTDSPYDKGPARWELIVDPAADYMVRSAKYSQEGDEYPRYEITSSGTKSMNGRFVPETATWQERRRRNRPAPLRFVFKNVTQQRDYKLFEETQKMLFGPYQYSTTVIDERIDPPSSLDFGAGQEYKTFGVIRPSLVGRVLEGLEEFDIKLAGNQIEGKMLLKLCVSMPQRLREAGLMGG
jgi:hypothetical protein